MGSIGKVIYVPCEEVPIFIKVAYIIYFGYLISSYIDTAMMYLWYKEMYGVMWRYAIG